MISIRQRLQCLPLLLGSLAAGWAFALLTRTNNGVATVTVALVASLPFVLAALTGVAKTTTA